MTLPPERHQIDAGRVPLEHVRGNLDVASITVFALVRYMTNHGIPMDARITADTFHDRPFLELTWETT
jgi:hypothetical protein